MQDCEGVRFLAEDSADTRLLDVPPGSFGLATEGDSGVGCISKERWEWAKEARKGKRIDEETRWSNERGKRKGEEIEKVRKRVEGALPVRSVEKDDRGSDGVVA